eukprot:gnl/MRDRNA2_/MRDRNA2_140005_c0_seq1.p1 gnl/MRDRNA2_/MRDRNA2_140005_c0~~gnl/MRDRNA2_/MRDRNA2_140005_c0_seq1.p1  ORF type:complete len:310 (-),score=72.24 gnl/MRDRNA2_/MRDRNA2_140005_c0_seq1:83-1012(-)
MLVMPLYSVLFGAVVTHGALPVVPTLTSGSYSMPALGLGVYMMKPGQETEDAVKTALELGYRMIDTAKVYKNEASVGKAMKESGIPREEIFLETKLWDDSHGYEKALQAAKESVATLGVDYIDLYIIHSPNSGLLIETWDALLQLQKDGVLRNIGVSNFGIKHLEALESHDRPLPVINQIEMHPLVEKERQELIDWCSKRGIIVQAYGSIFFGKSEHLDDARLVNIAKEKQKTVGQVLLRWGYQRGFQLIPKSVRRARLEENIRIFDFELSDEEMQTISSMEGSLGAYWNPLDKPVDLGATHYWKRDEM